MGGIHIINKPIAKPSVVLREEFDDWAVLYNPENGEVFGLNPVGVFIWKHIDGKQTLDDIMAAMTTTFENVPEASKDHLTSFITELEKHGLIGVEM